MHQAPAVQWRVPRMQAHALVLVLVWLLGLAAHGAWWLQAGQTAVAPHVWGLVVVLGTAGTSFAGWAMTGSGRLDWSGDTWTWNADGRAPVTGNLVTALDFQRLMVLRVVARLGARFAGRYSPARKHPSRRHLRRWASRPGTDCPVDHVRTCFVPACCHRTQHQ